MRKAVIFDIDGTLVDPVDLHAESWREAFSEVGLQVPFVDLRSQIGKGADMLIPSFSARKRLNNWKRSSPSARKKFSKNDIFV